ncbi:MAG: hypothetical protein ACTXOO_05220 [Sodalis sp. (in: enterobacteria)]
MTIRVNTVKTNLRMPKLYPGINNSTINTIQANSPTLLIGHVLSHEQMILNSSIIMPSAEIMQKLAGPSSQLHRMVHTHCRINAVDELFIIAVRAMTGAEAKGNISVSGNNRFR